MLRVAVLDDYQGLAATMAPWSSLQDVEVDFLTDPIAPAELVERLAPYEVLVLMRERTPLDAATLARLVRLRLVVTTGMRNASLDIAHLRERGIPVSGTGVPGGAGGATAGPRADDGPSGGVAGTVEVAWALILGLLKRVTVEDAALRDGRWQTGLTRDLAGLTLGLLGLGRLGSEMVPIARAFGMETIAWSANLDPETAAARGARRVDRETLFARSDVLSIHLVLSERTRHLVGAAELALMQSTAILINTSRGPIVDTGALIEALSAGRLAGAGIDVYDTEPVGAGHPLLGVSNTILLPHLGYASHGTLSGMYRQAVEDIAAFLADAPIRLLDPV